MERPDDIIAKIDQAIAEPPVSIEQALAAAVERGRRGLPLGMTQAEADECLVAYIQVFFRAEDVTDG